MYGAVESATRTFKMIQLLPVIAVLTGSTLAVLDYKGLQNEKSGFADFALVKM